MSASNHYVLGDMIEAADEDAMAAACVVAPARPMLAGVSVGQRSTQRSSKTR